MGAWEVFPRSWWERKKRQPCWGGISHQEERWGEADVFQKVNTPKVSTWENNCPDLTLVFPLVKCMFTFGVEQNNRISNIEEEKKKKKTRIQSTFKAAWLTGCHSKSGRGWTDPRQRQTLVSQPEHPSYCFSTTPPLSVRLTVSTTQWWAMGHFYLLCSRMPNSHPRKQAVTDRSTLCGRHWAVNSCSIWGLCTSVPVSLQASVFLTHRTALSLTGQMCQASAQQKNVRTQSSATMTCKRHFPMVFYMLSHPCDYLEKKKKQETSRIKWDANKRLNHLEHALKLLNSQSMT